MTFQETCQLIRVMRESNEPHYVYITLSNVHDFHEMVARGPDRTDLTSLFGPDIAASANDPPLLCERGEFILVGQMYRLLSSCLEDEEGMFLHQWETRLFIKMLANTFMARKGQSYILGNTDDDDLEDDEFRGWLEKLK